MVEGMNKGSILSFGLFFLFIHSLASVISPHILSLTLEFRFQTAEKFQVTKKVQTDLHQL